MPNINLLGYPPPRERITAEPQRQEIAGKPPMYRQMKRFFTRLLKNEDGPTTVEYAVMLALILASIIAAVGSVGVGTGGMYSNIHSELDAHGF